MPSSSISQDVAAIGSLPSSVAEPLGRSWTEAEAFAYCSKLTLGHYENFPVGSFFIPRELQPAIHSLYAFMRTADDFADENRQPKDEAERMTWLDSWKSMLSDCENGKAAHPIFIALGATLRTHQLPVQWLRDLLHAFTMDVTVRRYATAEDLLTYCRYSANPVGRLILTLFGYRDEERYRMSDAICTGLQLANHWQDIAVDLKKDRIYLPQEDMDRFGVTEEQLQQSLKPSPQPSPSTGRGGTSSLLPVEGESADRPDEGFRKLLAFEVERARDLFNQGRLLPERVKGRLRMELRFTWRGGYKILDKIEKQGYDVFRSRPIVTKADWLGIALRSLWSVRGQ